MFFIVSLGALQTWCVLSVGGVAAGGTWCHHGSEMQLWLPRCHNVACLAAHHHLAARFVQGIQQSTAVSLFVVMFFVGHIGRRART